jgi:hypothetical protein
MKTGKGKEGKKRGKFNEDQESDVNPCKRILGSEEGIC